MVTRQALNQNLIFFLPSSPRLATHPFFPTSHPHPFFCTLPTSLNLICSPQQLGLAAKEGKLFYLNMLFILETEIFFTNWCTSVGLLDAFITFKCIYYSLCKSLVNWRIWSTTTLSRYYPIAPRPRFLSNRPVVPCSPSSTLF